MSKYTIDAKGMDFKDLNELIHTKLGKTDEFVIDNACGQRYIGTGIQEKVKITINGYPGSDMAAFMDGPDIVVHGNAQDAIGNTMTSGSITVHGNAGDIVGYGMRGGKVFIKGNVGYRVGIHMKEYKGMFPVIVAGGEAKDFLGEYMAGGLLIVLGLNSKGLPVRDFVGTGMHAGRIFLRTDKIDPRLLGKEVKAEKLNDEDRKMLEKYVGEFCATFDLEKEKYKILSSSFIKLSPFSLRPYGRLYAY